MDYTPTKTAAFDAELSLMLDRAVQSVELARESGDDTRLRFALEWKRKVEAAIFGEEHEDR